MKAPSPPPAAEGDWHALGPDEVLARLSSSAQGLTSAEAAARLARHGPNLLPRAQAEGPLTLLWRQPGC